MQEFITYKNSNIAYTDIGKGNAVVLLHGFLENSTMWSNFVSELSTKNRVVCIDLLGHGNTDCIGYLHTMDVMADAVKEVLNHLRLRRVSFIGHSMGGYVALAFADKYLKNVKSLCLLNSTAQADTEERKVLRLRACEMAKTNYEALVKMSISNLFAANTRSLFAKDINELKKEALKTPVQGYIAATKGMRLRKNNETVLKQIDKRLIISGKKDPIIAVDLIKDEAERTKTPIRFLANGHMSFIEDKEALILLLKDFVK
ncbi:MAG: alpha/beta fold hydrolase [Tenacibaculum sp.]